MVYLPLKKGLPKSIDLRTNVTMVYHPDAGWIALERSLATPSNPFGCGKITSLFSMGNQVSYIFSNQHKFEKHGSMQCYYYLECVVLGKVSVCFTMASGWFTIKKLYLWRSSQLNKLSYKAGRLFQDWAAQMSICQQNNITCWSPRNL